LSLTFDLFVDSLGRERWYLKKIPGEDNVFHIIISGGTNLDNTFLSTNTQGNPDLHDKDDGSGRQRWVIELLPDTFEAPTYDETTNIALNKPTSQSSTAYSGHSYRAVDGNISGIWSHGSVTHTYSSANNWWQVDLEAPYNINHINIYGRTDCCSERNRGLTVSIIHGGNVTWSYTLPDNETPEWETLIPVTGENGTSFVVGDTVKVQIPGSYALSLAEVQVFTG